MVSKLNKLCSKLGGATPPSHIGNDHVWNSFYYPQASIQALWFREGIGWDKPNIQSG
ncbi:hypothetical protein THOB06_260051 [Vibrio rotiferianus]|nr:hypothetical protein THOG10_260051 [Vibrio rotiferianus]CAH1579366.1 hypothetical protein THOB06_260051 [Vibrio rotiferianus]